MTNKLTDRQYDIADAVCEYLAGKGEHETFTASILALRAKCTTTEVYPVLDYLIVESMVGVAGRGGAWMRFRAHRHGEVNEATRNAMAAR